MHHMNIFIYPEATEVSRMQMDADQFCQDNCDPWENGGCEGVTAEPVRLKRDAGIFPDFEAAADYLYSNERPDYETWAVRFRSEGAPTKRTRDAEARVERLRAEYEALLRSTLPAHRKSALIGCAACGSKLSREHLGERDRCPVCHASLLSKSDLDRIAAKSGAVRRAVRALRESRAKDGERAPVRWAMIAEVHC